MFFNLLVNSIKYSNGPANIEITGSIAEDTVSVVVRDEGIGIPEADRPAVFTKFARASNVGERPGSGLGLALVKEAMERHAGTVSLLPDDGTGLALCLRFQVVSESA
nr:sensor histidine kinase [Novosphingobium jiangmenense]